LVSKRSDFRKSLEIFWSNFTRMIDLVRIDVVAQISFQLLQKFFASGEIFRALRRIRVNPIEIVATNKKVAGETAAVLERIARGFSQFERFPPPFRHLLRVDHAGSSLFSSATRLLA